MATGPRPLEIQQLQAFLKTEFQGAIEGTGGTPEAREHNFLSKALAAYFLMTEAGASKADAVAATIDGGDDHGIDSVYISPTGALWLVQSKYLHKGSGEPKLGDASKFKDGVSDLLAGRFGRFNTTLRRRESAIRRLMDEPFAVRFALVYTGDSLNDDRVQLFGDLERTINDVQPNRARFVRFGLNDFHETLLARRAESSIDITIDLEHFGKIDGPKRAFYGVMQVGQLAALYQQHDHALVRANIRRYRGSSEVNAEISHTLTRNPAHFVYFNNGITILCQRITALGALPPDRSTGRFELTGASIINGAQTAGTVAMQPLGHYEAQPASVLVTCIEAPDEDDGFGDSVTAYRNSQNAVQAQDFIALDDRQEHWRKTLRASGVAYIYKPSVADPNLTAHVFAAQEAALWLAAAYSDRADWVHAQVLAQQHPDRLWRQRADFQGHDVADPGMSAYRRLFPDSLTARRLWRTTQIGRMVRDSLEADAATQGAPDAAFTQATVMFVAHLVFATLAQLADGTTLTLTTDERLKVSAAIDRVRAALNIAYAGQGWAGAEPMAVMVDPNALQPLKRDVQRALHT